ncbi:MAG: hypothetical protein FJ245_08940 [Nitrospira sp.]|nr:hypothetical protein [Nitrospira sp.]
MNGAKVWLALSLLVWLPLAGCGGYHGTAGHGRGMDTMGEKAQQEMDALVDQSVQDQDKAKRAKAVVGTMIQEIKQSYQEQRRFHQKLYEANANYEAAPEEFTKILDEANNSRMRSAMNILGLRFTLKAMLTASEWKALSEGMSRYQNRYRHGADHTEGKGGS